MVYLDYSVSSGFFLSYEIENGDGPGPELDNISKGFKDDIVVKPFHDPL